MRPHHTSSLLPKAPNVLPLGPSAGHDHEGGLQVTGDGSPTVFDRSQHASPGGLAGEGASQHQGELMHHRSGALAESLHVFGPAIEQAWKRALSFKTGHFPSRFGIVGLGLGYLERLCLALGPDTTRDVCIDSFESNPSLRDRFERWIQGVPEPWHDEVSQAFARNELERTPGALREGLGALARSGRLTFHGALDAATLNAFGQGQGQPRYHAVLFDPYSSRSAPELWDFHFLTRFLGSCADERFCVFATYASRTVLREALAQAGFIAQRRQGFGGKRECTLALRVCPVEQDG